MLLLYKTFHWGVIAIQNISQAHSWVSAHVHVCLDEGQPAKAPCSQGSSEVHPAVRLI